MLLSNPRFPRVARSISGAAMESSAFTGALTKAVLTYHALFGVPIKEIGIAHV